MGKMAAQSFEKDIYPLFTDEDADHMKKRGVLLRDYTYMKQPDNASNVYKRLKAKDMPPGGWPDEQIAKFKDWMDGGYQP